MSVDNTAAAAVYSIANEVSWLKNILLPGVQALANIKILDKQKDQYDDIDADRRKIIDRAADRYINAINNQLDDFGDAYPDVPLAAQYVPVNPCTELAAQIECNIGSTGRAGVWSKLVSRYNAQNDFTRMVVMDPRWYTNLDLYAFTLGDLLKGEMPQGDLMEVMTDSAEMALLTGRVGGNGQSLRRSISVERLRMQAEGREEMRRQAGLMGRVSPTSRMASPAEMMSTPAQRVGLALTQAQLIQNSLQNVFNRNAQKPPHRLALLNIRLEKAINRLQVQASKASLTNSFVPNYAAILQPVLNALTDSVGGNDAVPRTAQSSGDNPATGGNYLAQNQANPFTNGSSNLTMGHNASDRPAGY